jgi:hypothetical protein
MKEIGMDTRVKQMTKEIMEEDYRLKQEKIRILMKHEEDIWFKTRLIMWKKKIDDNNGISKVPRVSFMLRNKLAVGLRAHLDKVTQLINCASDRAETDDKLQITFVGTEYLMQKYINDTIYRKE